MFRVLKASWILPSYKLSKACLLFRKDFSLEKEVSEATLYITARGVYEATLNGQRVGDFIMAPGWTSYHNRIQVQSYNVTPLMKKDNTLIPELAEGWFKAEIDTAYGRVASRWWHEDGIVRYEISTPVKAAALVDGKSYELDAGVHLF